MFTPNYDQYRFYSFVAGLYLSPLQNGLQTAHAVSEMFADLENNHTQNMDAYREWATKDKTIIICNALNSAGVGEAYNKAAFYGTRLKLPATVFNEDTQSLNDAPTAAAIIVPRCFYDARPVQQQEELSFLMKIASHIFGAPPQSKAAYTYTDEAGKVYEYNHGSPEADFIKFLKSYRLA